MIQLHKIKTLNSKIKNKLLDGSMDSYHYQAILYCLTPLILLLFFALEAFILNLILSNLQSKLLAIFEFISGSIFFVINSYLLIFFVKKIVSSLKSKYILLSFLILQSVLLLLLTTLFWFKAILAELHNILILSFNFDMPFIFPYEAINPVINSLTIVVQNMMIFLLPIAFSFLLNSLLPEPLQKKDVSTKQKLVRMRTKLFILVVALAMSFIFSIIDKNNFGSISILTTLFTFLCTPKTILRLFSNEEHVESKSISDDILIKFDRIKFLYYEFIFAWSISIYIFDSKKTEDKILISAIIFFILLIITLITQTYLKNDKKDLFLKWIVDNEDDEIKKLHEKNIKPNKELSQMIDAMKQYLNNEIFIDGCHAKIVGVMICYDGDFFDVKFTSGDKKGTQKRYSASNTNFMTSLLNLNKSPQS